MKEVRHLPELQNRSIQQSYATRAYRRMEHFADSGYISKLSIMDPKQALWDDLQAIISRYYVADTVSGSMLRLCSAVYFFYRKLC